MGSDNSALKNINEIMVSIHAPTWGATTFSQPSSISRIVSIHAPTWGATNGLTLPQVGQVVSIHAPTWGATCCHCHTDNKTEFQSTLPHGERHSAALYGVVRSQFQSTLPHGERPCAIEVLVTSCGFQSTLPHGERHEVVHGVLNTMGVSIHAPTWGATVHSL